MLKKSSAFTLLGLMLLFAGLQSINAQTAIGAAPVDDAAAKIRSDVTKRGTGEKARVNVKMRNGTKMKGFITQAGDDSFTITDSKTKQTSTLAYSDVAQVKKPGLSKAAKILMGVGVGVAVTAVVFAVALHDLCIMGPCS